MPWYVWMYGTALAITMAMVVGIIIGIIRWLLKTAWRIVNNFMDRKEWWM